MSTLNYIGKLLGIKAEYIKNMRETDSEHLLYVEVPAHPHTCPHCHAKTTRIKGYTNRAIRHTTANEKPIRFLYRQRRYVCSCSRPSTLPPVLSIDEFKKIQQKKSTKSFSPLQSLIKY
ncbi:hypothetical protein VER_07260 [Veillonella sp. R32]|nr:hypothetical protein VER_07260 [Veillonella sp. R32]